MELIDKAKLLEHMQKEFNESKLNRDVDDRPHIKILYEGQMSAFQTLFMQIQSGHFDIKEPEVPAPAFKKGDKVRHKTDTSVYLGEVLEISKTGKTARVQWTKYDQRVYLFGAPWPANYLFKMLELIKEPIQGEGEKTEP